MVRFLHPRHILRSGFLAIFAIALLLYTYQNYAPSFSVPPASASVYKFVLSSYNWAKHKHNYPVAVSDMYRVPAGPPVTLPPVQKQWTEGEAKIYARTYEHMAGTIKTAFVKTYTSYEKLAFGHDEVTPLTGRAKDPFNGWGAMIVDSLDTLWIMGLKAQWERALKFVAKLDWDRPTSENCNLFETGIRFLGGLLSAYDLSGEPVLLYKAIELGDMMYAAWDNPLRLPRGRFTWQQLKAGHMVPLATQSIAGIGSFSMEFTRLSMLTGDPKYYDAIHRITLHFARTQNATQLPGLWPVHVNAERNFTIDNGKSNTFTYGASADSFYEYLPKMHALLGATEPLYSHLYRTSTDAAIAHLVYRPILPGGDNVLFMGDMSTTGTSKDSDQQPTKYTFKPTMDHLTCFVGGMFLLGGKLTGAPRDILVGEKLALGCASAYQLVTPAQIMPEKAIYIQCDDLDTCPWDESRWAKVATTPGTPHGIATVTDPKYILRPEAIESIFYLFRVSGDIKLPAIAEDMWTAISRACEGERAFAGVKDVTKGVIEREDSMESFFLAETLKYFYLIFSSPLMVGLDEWVFNTEAHPFRRWLPGMETPASRPTA